MRPPRTIIVCTTPRSGSTLLCALLRSCGVAGHPESWFRNEDRPRYAARWQVTADSEGRIKPADYLAAAVRAGQTPNGVFGLRLQADTLDPFLAELRSLFGAADNDRALLEMAFGPCHFVYCRRQDDVAQAISRLKAETTQVWHVDGRGPAPPGPRAEYDPQRLDAFRAEARNGNARWQAWFAAQDIQPLPIRYERLSEHPAAQVRALLNALALEVPDGTVLSVPNRRMADRESADWAVRYRAELALAGKR